MDLATLGGLLLAAGAIAAAEFLDGGSLHELWSLSALVLIVGGTLGATAISYALSDLLAVPRAVLSAFRSGRQDLPALVRRIVSLADKARREGLLSLQDEVDAVENPVLRRGLIMVADGIDPAEVEAALDTEGRLIEQRALRAAAVLETAGGYAPTMGIIGTVAGLVRVLGNMQDQSQLAAQIAVAFLATFYGIATANLFWLPLAAKLKRNVEATAQSHELILEGLMAVQAGLMPRRVQDRLSVYLTPADQARLEAGGDGGERT